MQNDEVELKFALPAGSIPALEAHPLLQGAVERDEKPLVSTYFDTPEADLRKALIACRIREDGETRVQTVKASSGDATARHEWECELEGEEPDLALLPAARLPRPLRQGGAKLAPVFRVDVDRRSWTIARGDSVIEAALDRGWISAGEENAPLCEFELELKQGEREDLFDVARIFCADVPLDLDLRPKAQRGWTLRDGVEQLAMHAPAPQIERAMPFANGFRALAQACLEPLSANAPILRATHAPEALHQTRTAVRRLRALLRVFERHVRDDQFDRLRAELKWLSHALGAARDLDVAGARFSKHMRTAELALPLQARRDKAYARVIEALASPRYRLLLVDFVHWLTLGDWARRPPRKISRGSIADVAALEFHRWDRRICKTGEKLDDLDAEERHKLRIRAKSFAYACELTQSLTPRGERKSHAAYVKALKRFQSRLGDLNDLRIAEGLLEDLTAEASKAALRRAGRRNARKAQDLAQAAHRAWSRFFRAARPEA